MTDRPFSQATAAAVQRYLGAFLSGAPARDAMHDVVTDVQYWGDSEHLEVLRIAHGVLGVRARIAEDVEFLTLIEDVGLTPTQAVEVMELDAPPPGVEEFLPSPEPTEPTASAEAPDPTPTPDPKPKPTPEPDPEPTPELDTELEPGPVVESWPEEQTPDEQDEAPSDDPATEERSAVVSIDTAIDEEVQLVDKASLPLPTEKEGRRSRRERRREAARVSEEHARRAREAEEAEQQAREQARPTAPVEEDADIARPGSADETRPATAPGEPHVRVTGPIAIEPAPDEDPARDDEQDAGAEDVDLDGSSGAETLFSERDEPEGTDATDEVAATVEPTDDRDVVAREPEPAAIEQPARVGPDEPPPLGFGVAVMAVAGAAAVTATLLLLFL